MTSRSASPRLASVDGRDGTVERVDPLAVLRADAATQAALAVEALPQCRQTKSVLKILEGIEDACVVRACLGVTDARRRDKGSFPSVESASGSTEAEEKRTTGDDDVDEFAADAPGWHDTLANALEARIERKLRLAKWLLGQRRWCGWCGWFGCRCWCWWSWWWWCGQ